MVLTSTLVGRVGGLNQLTIKNILTYSSIIHSAWILSICCVSLSAWFIYFSVYSIISVRLIYIIYKTAISHLFEINSIKTNKTDKITLILTIISLGGLPPFLGFIIKLIAAQIILNNLGIFITLVLIRGSLVSLYYYVRVIYTMLVLNSQKTILQSKTSPQISVLISTVVIVGNIATPTLISLV